MSETEKDSETPLPVDSKEPASPKNQLVALLTLLPVLGFLWLTIQYLPKLGDWMGAKIESGVSSVSGDRDSDTAPAEQSAIEAEELTPVEPSLNKSNGSSTPVDPPDSSSLVDFKSQIVEQLGGAEKVEVRHLAVSDDGERMVAAIKINTGAKAKGSGLIEVFFDRDEFGRFLSTEDSPVPEQLILWGTGDSLNSESPSPHSHTHP